MDSRLLLFTDIERRIEKSDRLRVMCISKRPSCVRARRLQSMLSATEGLECAPRPLADMRVQSFDTNSVSDILTIEGYGCATSTYSSALKTCFLASSAMGSGLQDCVGCMSIHPSSHATQQIRMSTSYSSTAAHRLAGPKLATAGRSATEKVRASVVGPSRGGGLKGFLKTGSTFTQAC